MDNTNNNNAGSTVPPATTTDSKESRVQPSTTTAAVGNLAVAEVKVTGQTKTDETSPQLALRAQLVRIEAALQAMEAQTKKQRNVGEPIKTGMAVIREAVERAQRECDRLRLPSGTAAKGDPTVTATKRKREATGLSPEQSAAYQKVAEDGGWKKVVSRKTVAETKKEPKRAVPAPVKKHAKKVATHKDGKGGARTSAVLIKPSDGVTYADALRRLKAGVDPESAKVQIQNCRKTKDGGLLLRLRSGATERRDFQEKLKQTLGGDGTVKDLTPATRLEILDIDSVTDVTDITDALRRETGDGRDPRVHIFGPNKQDICLAVVEVEEGAAQTLLRKGRIKIGWTNCRIRRRLTVPRYYQCLGYGLTRKECKGPDRSRCCWTCGQQDHDIKTCKTKDRKCFLCSATGHKEVAHRPGSGACGVFRAALENLKKKSTA